MPIKNGSDYTLNQNLGTLPQVNSAYGNWKQPMTFNLITKSNVAFEVSQTSNEIHFEGCWQPLGPQQLVMKPEGQREWKWFELHTDVDLELSPDQIVEYFGERYRVSEKRDYNRYGYFNYHLCQDYQGGAE
jgi:hypothetical protein